MSVNNVTTDGMMKVIFLDIDGVLNHMDFYKRRRPIDTGLPYSELDPVSMQYLNEIIDATGAEVVISSSWRGYPELHKWFVKLGYKHKEFYGVTPYKDNRHRGQEIQAYLDLHPEVTQYIIIDDDDDMLDEQLPYFIQTDVFGSGLNEEVRDKAIKLLNNGLF